MMDGERSGDSAEMHEVIHLSDLAQYRPMTYNQTYTNSGDRLMAATSSSKKRLNA